MNSNRSSSAPLFVMVGNAAEFERAAIAGVESGYPGAAVVKAGSLGEAESAAADGEVLLILLHPTEAEIATALAAVDGVGLPRWGVVAFGSHGEAAPAVMLRGNETATDVARWFGLALTIHRLRRDNARLRGDLCTIGTRVAHDLRSPLGGILTTVEVLKEVLADESTERARMLDPLLESSEGLSKLVRQLSLITKASGGACSRERFDMGLAFWSAFQRVEREALALGATIQRPAAWPQVDGEQSWVEAMWHALLSNSLRHAGAKPRIEVGWTRRGGENRFWVIDPGEVATTRRAALFQPFNTLHRPNAPRGLGLPLVQRLAELQGGKAGYEPAPGGGACFYFSLPIHGTETAMTSAHGDHAKR